MSESVEQYYVLVIAIVFIILMENFKVLAVAGLLLLVLGLIIIFIGDVYA